MDLEPLPFPLDAWAESAFPLVRGVRRDPLPDAGFVEEEEEEEDLAAGPLLILLLLLLLLLLLPLPSVPDNARAEVLARAVL